MIAAGRRGQALAIVWYLRAYEELDDLRYLAVGRKLLKYSVDNYDETLVPPWDFKDPQIATDPQAVPKDTSAAAIVVEQLARLSLKHSLDFLLRASLWGYLEPMIEGLLGHLMVLWGQDGQPDQDVLLDGCFNYPKQCATNSELVCGNCAFTLRSILFEDKAVSRVSNQCYRVSPQFNFVL